jgi:thiol-disulfide isomerase/thioredoxin
MRRTGWIIAAIGLVAVLAIGIAQGGGGKEEPASRPSTNVDELTRGLAGAPAPLAALHGRANRLEPGIDFERYEEVVASLKGYPVVVNGWASWCGPCKLEFPIFQRVAAREGKRVAFLGLNVSDNRQEAEEFLGKVPVPYPSLQDSDSRIAQQVGSLGGLPFTIFYDKDGKKFLHQGGYRSERDLLRDMKRYAGA